MTDYLVVAVGIAYQKQCSISTKRHEMHATYLWLELKELKNYFQAQIFLARSGRRKKKLAFSRLQLCPLYTTMAPVGALEALVTCMMDYFHCPLITRETQGIIKVGKIMMGHSDGGCVLMMFVEEILLAELRKEGRSAHKYRRAFRPGAREIPCKCVARCSG